MKKEEVKSKLDLVKAAIKKIVENDDVRVYITKDKHLPGVGYIHEIEDFKGLILAHKEITTKSTNDLSASVTALGLTEEEVPENKVKILGFKPEHWFKDINTRLSELRDEIKLEKLKAAEATLTKHLSDGDKFTMETAGIDALLIGEEVAA
jgi:hypothetical protein